MKPKIAILNSGGDCAGLNGVIAGIVKTGYHDFDFIGLNKGLDGLLDPGTEVPLTRDRVRGIAHLGGTILTTVNKGRFAAKVGTGQVAELDPQVIATAQARYQELGLSGVVVIGGDGTLSSAWQLSQAGLNVIGVPKSIDNDLRTTERTFGFESAVEIVVEALDRIHTTATSHERIMIVEVMGRHAGWIALHAGIAGGADIILIPELPFSYTKVAQVIKDRIERGLRQAVIVVAEGAVSIEESGPVYKNQDVKGEFKIGGIAERISKFLAAEIPDFENRSVVLGHVQRGGSPTSDDRLLAFMYGAYATEMLRDGRFGQVMSWNGRELSSVPLSEVVAGSGIKTISPDHPLVRMARQAEVSFGD